MAQKAYGLHVEVPFPTATMDPQTLPGTSHPHQQFQMYAKNQRKRAPFIYEHYDVHK